jgi:hypothetical protein
MASEIELLNAVGTKRFEACEAEWRELLGRLRLGLSYVPAIEAVVRQGQWKSQPNAMAYVRKGAVRLAVHMGIVDIRPRQNMEVLACELQYRDEDGEQLGHDDKLGMALHEYEGKFGPDYDEEFYALGDRVAGPLMDENLSVQWEQAADLADLDPGERIVMDLQMIGFGREGALAACSTEEERRFLQAAWRRFDRHKGALSASLQSAQPHRARRLKTDAQTAMELLFLETPEGGLKISFRKLVPES